MPTVAIVEGVRIVFYADEHPPPHFHAVFAEHRASIEIATLSVLRGSLPANKLKAVKVWAEPRREKLLAAWYGVRSKRQPGRIT